MHPRRIWRGNLPAETGSCGRRICSRGRGGPPDFPRRRRPRCIAPCGGVVGRGGRPAPFLPCRRKPAATGTDINAGLHALRAFAAKADLNLVGSIGGTANAGSCASAAGARNRSLRLLFLARWIRLPWRHMGARRRVRPDRLRHPRGLRGAAEAQQPCEEIGAMLLKRQQDGFRGEGDLHMHVVMHSARILTDGSGETASTLKIVSDARGSICGWADER